MVNSKFVGFFALIGGAAVLIGNFVPKLGEQYYLVLAGGALSALIGLVALGSRNRIN
jgi:hypothetical protein